MQEGWGGVRRYEGGAWEQGRGAGEEEKRGSAAFTPAHLSSLRPPHLSLGTFQ